MGSFGILFFIFGLVYNFVIVIAVEPHSKIKGNVESLLELTPWNWKHLNTSLKVDSPVTVDVSLTTHYRLTGKHLNKFLKTVCDGVYTIYPDMKTRKLVYCDMTTDGGGWTTYKEGFGKADGEYWLGNEDIHLLTTLTKNELRVDLQKFSGEKAYAKYSKFSVGSESEKYKIVVGGYSGNAGDSLGGHNGLKFSTKDQDNDTWGKSCAVTHQGAWWFGICLSSNLNGMYQKSGIKTWKGIVWYHLEKKEVSLKNARMMIRSNI
uniref:Tenascin-R n=1 Tax=Magallana gigas TaxID=29159 RepID=K1QP83_MAGGI